MSEWKDCTIADLVAINRATYSPKEGWPFVNYLDTGSVTENNIEQIQHLDVKTDKVPSRARRKVVPGSIVYSTVRPNQRHYALIKSVPENFLVSTGFAVLDVKPGVADERFVFSYLTQQTVIDKLQSIAEQGVCTYPALNPDDIGALTVRIPDLPIQRKIAAVLGALDDKIELNRKMNATLETMAQTLFKSWFVDFEPFGGKMPEGWRMGRLGESCKCILGGTPSRTKSEYWGGDVPWLNSGAVNEFRIVKPSEYITKEGLECSAAKMLPAKTVVLAITGATLGQYSLLEIDSAANQSVIGVLQTEAVPYEYVYPLIVNSMSELLTHATGGAQQHINKQDVENLQILLPDQRTMDGYRNQAASLYERIGLICHQNETLAQLRDMLLPKLMSGELNVDDVKID